MFAPSHKNRTEGVTSINMRRSQVIRRKAGFALFWQNLAGSVAMIEQTAAAFARDYLCTGAQPPCSHRITDTENE